MLGCGREGKGGGGYKREEIFWGRVDKDGNECMERYIGPKAK
jgi:hypothetical protein